MVVSASLAVVFGIATVFLFRSRVVRALPGLTLILFGFTLASTGLGPTISRLLTGLVQLVSGIRV
ncbi:hypothetical protein ACFC26_28075 [Kitasatospora purpeofusca]|uniref:hypothetical protein n=1 Tax=Kitasatospora purpeofusca TaxID=67352 RepID=UPI0035E2393C